MALDARAGASVIPGRAMMLSGRSVIAPRWYDAIVAASANKLVFDVSDLSTLYQDEAGTVPVTAVGQTIKAIRNKGTGGGLAVSATGAALAWDATAGKYYFVPPATNRFQITPTALTGRTDRSVIAVGSLPNVNGTYEYFFQFGADGSGNHLTMGHLGTADGNCFSIFNGSSTGYAAAARQSGVNVYVGTTQLSGANDNFATYRNNSSLASRTGAGATIPAGSVLNIGDWLDAGGVARAARIYALIFVDRILTDTERAACNAALTP